MKNAINMVFFHPNEYDVILPEASSVKRIFSVVYLPVTLALLVQPCQDG